MNSRQKPSKLKTKPATKTPAKTTRAVPAPAASGKARPPPGMSVDENWDVRLGFLMHDVSRLRRGVFDDFMRPLGITRSQWWVLAYLSRHDGMIQSDLANALDLGKAALGGLIDRLEASGFLERRADDSDRRVKRVYLSSLGTRMVKEMNLRSHEMSERILEGFSQAARLTLLEGLTRVKTNLLAIKREDGGSDEDESA